MLLSLILLLLLLSSSSLTNINGQGISHTIHEIDSSLRDIKWGNVDGTIVFVLSSFGRLYRSEDEGSTWEDYGRITDRSLDERA